MGIGYLVLMLGMMGLSFIVSSRFKSKIKKYSQMGLRAGITGAETAQKMLNDYGIYDVKILNTPGQLTDHYNPVNKTVNLSDMVYNSNSIAAVAVAAHECGHAVQHAQSYSMLKLRSSLVPVQNASGKILNMVMLASMFGGAMLYSVFPMNTVLLVIIAAYAVMAAFALVTLPVEFDASKRALAWIDKNNITQGAEHEGAKDALKWAAMTYVVAAVGALASLAYYLMIFMNRRD